MIGARERPRSRTTRLRLRRLGLHGLCLIIAVGVFAAPIVYLCLQSVKSYPEFLRNPAGLPAAPTLKNFGDAWSQGTFGAELVNSLLYSVVPDAITLLLGVFLAFPVARNWFRFSNAVYAFFLFSGFLPGALIPLFIEARFLHLYNSSLGYLVMTSLAGAGFFFFVGYIRGIPRELDEAAALDGCGYVRFIIQIILPEMRPALATFGIFGFVANWNNLVLPLVMLSDQDLWPVTRGLYSFFGEFTQNWPLISAGTMIVAAPILVLFALLQRHLVAGVAGGAAAGSQGVSQAAASTRR